MNDEYISFGDLQGECGIDDAGKFKKMLRRNGFSISPNKPVPRKTADKITRYFTGSNIDWYKYRTRKRDIMDSGPLSRGSSFDDRIQISRWFSAVSHEAIANATNDITQEYLIGLGLQGGFLEGDTNEGFAIEFSKNMNVLIGDRGTGKSTILNLVSTISGSVREYADILVERLVDTIASSTIYTNSEPEYFRRIRKALKHYDIDQFAVFFLKQGGIFCFFVDTVKRTFDLLGLDNGSWTPAETFSPPIGPQVLFLQQGEITRISEDTDSNHLNRLIDALYPSLYKNRLDLAAVLRRVSDQYEHFQPVENETVIQSANAAIEFLRARTSELRSVQVEFLSGELSDFSLALIQGYMDEHRQYFESGRRSWSDMDIPRLFVDKAYGSLYVGRIMGFLEDRIEKINHLRSVRSFLDNEAIGQLDTKTIDLMIGPKSESKDTLEDSPQESLDLSLLFSKQGSNRERAIEEIVTQISAIETSSTKIDSSMRIDFRTSEVDKVIQDLSSELLDFLGKRLKVLSRWIYIYSNSRVEWEPAFDSICNVLIDFLQEKSALLQQQATVCQQLTQRLAESQTLAKLVSVDADQMVRDREQLVARIRSLGDLYHEIVAATPMMSPFRLANLAKEYDEASEQVVTMLGELYEDAGNSKLSAIYDQIEIELLQGSGYRPFRLLSFGQKSAIIINIVLASTQRQVIALDQPEDNLDASSIVNMLAPALNKFGENRQLVIATHSSNLVMGLDAKWLNVLESNGNRGRIRVSGPPWERTITREMMNVLEGGMAAFERRLSLFEHFITRLHGQVSNMDINLIESSFRRRTLDQFRNFLQPVLSDKALLDFARHELKQREHGKIDLAIIRLHDGIQKYRNGDTMDQLLDGLEELSDALSEHIKKLTNVTEEIRLLDTYPQPTWINIYPLMIEFRDQLLQSVDQSRKIEFNIDERLENIDVWMDLGHLKLILGNLVTNSLRATETQVIKDYLSGDGNNRTEIICVRLLEVTEASVAVIFSDNGCGIPVAIREKLYIEKCTTRDGADHGLGGIIISKLLSLNGGSIRIIDGEDGMTTNQELMLLRIPRE